ncbi:MAG: glycosyltransferase [Caulobacteraceae bacterium]|nr:glycosyltransferase [Caulobacteraceae bacterium]
MMNEFDTRTQNASFAQAAPRLSVLTPFFRDDPRPLLAALDREAARLDGAVEVIILDDGSGEPGLAAAVAETAQGMALPTQFICLLNNFGRARGRNRMAAEARGEWLLFLDSDMLPDNPDFLRVYLDLIAAEAPAVAFGGLSMLQATRARDRALHRRMSLQTDCTPAPARALNPEKHVFTSNLLIRSSVFASCAFDESFSGWGWEDVEWGMRASRGNTIRHIANTATHLGLDPAPVMAAKYEQSAANFARVVAEHREIVERYPSYRVARVLRRLPLRPAWRPLLKALALAEAAPLAARAFAMRLYRAALYAEAVS